jgi:predicted ATPase/Tfp pilus assembly protein PilF
MARRQYLKAQVQRDEHAAQFAAALAALLHELHLTHQQVADALNLTRHTIDYWTRVETPKLPSEENLDRLCGFLDQRKSGAGHHLASIAHGSAVSSIAPSARSTEPVPLRIPATSFIGREREVDELLSVIQQQRLITLIGTGGIGKTRLALRLASESVMNFADGVRLVELADLTQPELVSQAIAQALNLKERKQTTWLKILIEKIGAQQMLLVLDNCEHLLIACADVLRDLLKHCPNLHVLATSREPIAIDGEVRWQVPALAVPDSSISPDRLMRFDATRLFIDRALVAQRGLKIGPQDAINVAHICQQLDGIALAIELAAARVSDLPIDQIAARIDRRLELLTKGNPIAPARHQTLRTVIEWGYDLLPKADQTFLNRLSVFAGGWTAEAAEAVGGADRKAAPVKASLARLVDKSLVVAEDRSGELRYRLLDTIREFAREQLIESREADVIRSSHLNYYLRVVQESEPHWHTVEQARYLKRFDLEVDNLRAALDWSLQSRQVEAGAQIAVIIEAFWYARSYWREGLNWLLKLIEQLRAQPPSQLYALTLNRAGGLALRLGEYDLSREKHSRSYTISEQFNHKAGMARSLNNLAMIAEEQGDLAEARSIYERSLMLASVAEDARGHAIALNNLGIIAKKQGHFAEAQKFYEDSLALKRQLNDQPSVVHTLNNLGILARLQNDGATARYYFNQSMALTRQLGDKRLYATSIGNMGMLEQQEQNYDQARAYYEEIQTIFEEAGDLNSVALTRHNLGQIAYSQYDYRLARQLELDGLHLFVNLQQKTNMLMVLEALALIDLAEQQVDRATKLLAFTLHQRQRHGTPAAPIDQVEIERAIDRARAELDTAFEAAWQSGAEMTIEQALKLN